MASQPDVTYSVFPRQAEAINSKARELLVGGDTGGFGGSHLLRLVALHSALNRAGIRIALLQRNLPELRRGHLEGPDGLFEMLSNLRRADVNAVDVTLAEAKFSNGSTIRWFGCSTDAEINRALGHQFDVLLVDEAEEIPYEVYKRFRERTIQSPSKYCRVVAVTKNRSRSWVAEHWRHSGEGGRVFLEITPEHLGIELEAPDPPPSFAEWIDRVCPEFPWYPHTERWVEAAQRVASGEIFRLAVEAPPRYGKSLIFSRLLPAYWLYLRPGEWSAVISAEESLATMLSKDARTFYASAGGLFRADAKEAALWRTMRGGGMWAQPLGGSPFGFGFHLGIVDDPFGSWASAQRKRVRDAANSYLWQTFWTRREKFNTRPGGAAIVVIQHRLHEKDLIGSWLAKEAESPDEEHPLHVVHSPALQRPRRQPWPQSVVVLPDPRIDGEALCPEIETEEQIKAKEDNPQMAAAVAGTDGQDPLPDAGGGLYERDWWAVVGDCQLLRDMRSKAMTVREIVADLISAGELPRFRRMLRSWDLGASKNGDPTASTLAGIESSDALGPLWLDATEDQLEATDVKGHILRQARMDGKAVEQIIPIDPATGKIASEDIAAALRAEGFRVETVTPRDSKRGRALPHAGFVRPKIEGAPPRGRLLKGPWNDRFIEVHHAFTGLQEGEDDHLVDCTSDVFNLVYVQKGGLWWA